MVESGAPELDPFTELVIGQSSVCGGWHEYAWNEEKHWSFQACINLWTACFKDPKPKLAWGFQRAGRPHSARLFVRRSRGSP